MIKFVIYGAGVRGKRLAKFAGYEHIAAFVDGNKNLQGTEYRGIPIISFDEYRISPQNAHVIVYYHDEAQHQKEIVNLTEMFGIEIMRQMASESENKLEFVKQGT